MVCPFGRKYGGELFTLCFGTRQRISLAKETAKATLAIKRGCPTLKCAHNTLHRLVEHNANDALQNRIPKFEINEKGHFTAPFDFAKAPIRLHVAKRTVQVFGVDLVRIRPQHNPAGKAFAKHFETDDKLRLHNVMVRLRDYPAHARRRAPGQKFRISAHVGNQIIHLLRAVGQETGFGMGRHRVKQDLRAALDKDVSRNGAKIKGKTMPQRPYVIDQMISAKTIAARIEDLSREIESEFKGTNKLVVVGLLRGSFVFIADLVRELDLPIEVDFLEASSYGDSMQSSREVRILKDLRGAIEGRDVLVVEDIVDTGHTMHHVTGLLSARKPAKLRTIALLDKPSRREVDFKANWTGFDIPDAFVVGYGIDFAQRDRNLPYIGQVRFVD